MKTYELLDPYNTGALYLHDIDELVEQLDFYSRKLVKEILEEYVD
jgi:Ca2+-binding EF-hand superfamily protein